MYMWLVFLLAVGNVLRKNTPSLIELFSLNKSQQLGMVYFCNIYDEESSTCFNHWISTFFHEHVHVVIVRTWISLLIYVHMVYTLQTEHVNIGIIFSFIGNSQWWLYATQSKSDWPFNTQSKVLQDDRLILENDGETAIHINMPYWTGLNIHFNCQFFLFISDTVIHGNAECVALLGQHLER